MQETWQELRRTQEVGLFDRLRAEFRKNTRLYWTRLAKEALSPPRLAGLIVSKMKRISSQSSLSLSKTLGFFTCGDSNKS
jgi:hypothetical protein